LGSALAAATRALDAAGVEAPRREAQVLIGHALGVGRETLIGYPERRLSAAEQGALVEIVDRRRGREPAAYILGRREFWSLDLRVTPDTLIPRPDSETLVEAALASVTDRGARLRLLDLGTGSGCLLLALLCELGAASGVGVDIAPGAVAVARDNADRLGLAHRTAFVAGDWGRALRGRFDIVVANPPYIDADACSALAPEIARHEPSRALDGGRAGLDRYAALAPDVARLLAPAGRVVIEVGDGMADAVAAIMASRGLTETSRRRDLAGIERALVLIHDLGKEL